MITKIKEAKERNELIIFVDEVIFSFNTFRKRAWSHKYQNISVNQQQITVQAQAVVVGISQENGFERYLIRRKSIKTEDFIEFLNDLAQQYPEQKLNIFLDNLRVHKSKEVLKVYEQLNMQPIFNIPYCPQFNGIENYFSILKQQYKNMLLKYILENTRFSAVDLIQKSIEIIEDDKVKACVNNGLKEIKKQKDKILLV